ncbi:hypothetical protein BB8028_0003g02960 [Beauveria bassiana]|uniref:F-box domain-containing protein n=1 Tax=Beauveria bassiana TaxID=176275 RepID=A0A2S7Y744_BEABA|nr:hypothetical protein BB8028_0003g02960 [Beauveria bassiana]
MVQLLELPVELQVEIFGRLAFPDNVNLKYTCRGLYDLINFDHTAQMEAENSKYAVEKRLFVCNDCHRMRRSHQFADKMIKKSRRRGGSEALTRFCIDCGVTPKGEKNSLRYTPGSHISIQGVHHVICQACQAFTRGAQRNDGVNLPYCLRCCRGQHAEDQRREIERRSLDIQWRGFLENRALRRSDHDENAGNQDLDDRVSSLTSDEIYMDMIQAEADGYMNSPKAGSE